MKVGGVVGGLCVMGAVLQPCLLQGGCRYQARLEGQSRAGLKRCSDGSTALTFRRRCDLRRRLSGRWSRCCANSVGLSEAMRRRPPKTRCPSHRRANSVGLSEAMRRRGRPHQGQDARVPTALVSRKRCDTALRASGSPLALVPTALASRKRCDIARRGFRGQLEVPTALVSRKRCDFWGCRPAALFFVPTALVSRKRCDDILRHAVEADEERQQRWSLGSDATHQQIRLHVALCVPTALVSRKRCDSSTRKRGSPTSRANSVGLSEAMRRRSEGVS